MTSFQFCLPVSDSKIVNLFSDFFPVNSNQLSCFLKIFLVADALARAGRGPGAAAPRPGGDPSQFLCISRILFNCNDHLSPENGSSPKHL